MPLNPGAKSFPVLGELPQESFYDSDESILLILRPLA